MHQRGLHAPLRWAYLVLGGLMVLLGIIGAFLPVMPTTVFLLLALACFSKSSPRLEQWLLQHPRFGPSLRAWREHRAIPKRAKILACLGMLLGLIVLAFSPVPKWAVASVALCELMVAIYIIRRPDLANDEAKPAATPCTQQSVEQGLKRSLVISLLLHLGLLSYFVSNWASTPVSPKFASEKMEVTLLQAAAPAIPLEQTEAKHVSQAAAKQAPKEAKPTPKAIPQPSEQIVSKTLAESTLSASAQPEKKASEQASSKEVGPLNKTAAIAAAPAAPPASQQQASGGSNSWEGKVLARLERFRRYPTAARMRGFEGVVYLRILINREGQVLSAKLERSSGVPALDKAAMEALNRAAPLPRIPADRPEELELLVPFEFFIEN
ncbi:TonB family protein [Janthinobacterium sp. B9-8]|uniref:TonB family protein n=1 Tax=Janthinobacterium sp. B9-8 TaxID=1236179 RepID=UPI0009E79E59|nr:TonB family protein [Janthinobacterium sp. B9-8]